MGQVLTVNDLFKGKFADRDKNSVPPFFAVFGKPIAHSMSPLMQNAAIAEIAKSDASYEGAKYFAFEIAPTELCQSLKYFHAKNFVGINLTIPHKEVVMSALDEIDEPAKLAGACNTLLRTESGWKGFNTDGFGLESAVEKAFGRNFTDADVLLIGAGGAARGAAFHICLSGAKSLTIANRSPERLDKLISDLHSAGFAAKAISTTDILKNLAPDTIVINATSVGLKDSDAPIIDFKSAPKSILFFDMPYRKDCQTTSVAAAQSCGIKAQSGLPMLAYQGAKSLSIWTGKPMLGQLMLRTLIKE